MDTSSAESLDRLRQRIDDEINSLEESLQALDLKSRRNALAPISRLPPETLAAIFSFVSSPVSQWTKQARHLEWIYATHVCSRWRETALNHPHLWSHIEFSRLTPAGAAEILTRAKMVPLYLEADADKFSRDRVKVFKRQLEAHISHTRHLCISGSLHLENFVYPAPILESLSLSNTGWDNAAIPINIFNRTIPSLTSLELENWDISWKSPLLKGLRTLEIKGPSEEARPTLEDWLDALDEMPQLEVLILQHASPSSSLATALTPASETSRTVTSPSLTKFHITASAGDCVLALAHLVLPALTWLHVDAGSEEPECEDVRQLLPYIARNVHVLQGTERLRSIQIGGDYSVEVHAWTTFYDRNLVRTSLKVPASLIFTTGGDGHPEVDTAILDALLTRLPLDSVLFLTARSDDILSKEFWLSHVPRWPLLQRASLFPATFEAFSDMLAEDAPPDGPRLPSLTKLILTDVELTVPVVYGLRDMLIERVEQGVPLEVLEFRMWASDDSATQLDDPIIQLLAEIVVDVQEVRYDYEYLFDGDEIII